MYIFQTNDNDNPKKSGKLKIIPEIPEKLEKRTLLLMSEMDKFIPLNHLLKIKILRINNPPRKLDFEYIVKDYSASHSYEIKEIDIKDKKKLESISFFLIEIAVLLIKRWPANLKPQSIGFITDGKSLIFNPGQPEAYGLDWYNDHHNGKSRCAIIIGSTENPLNMNW